MLDANELKRLTQLDPARELNEDRAVELSVYLGLAKEDAVKLYRALNVDRVSKPPKDLFSNQDHPSVVRSYLNDVFHKQSITRLMLHYNRLDLAHKIISVISADRGSDDYSGVSVLDYGCGAADYALSFAVLGAYPVLVDIGGGPIEFASFRFKCRGMEHQSVAVTAEVEHPELPAIDIVNATEVLEHVVDPPRLIERFSRALRPSGYFTFSAYPLHAKSVGGSHLQIAADRRLEALDVLNANFERVHAEKSVGYVYRKK